jgi:hypothetical protein
MGSEEKVDVNDRRWVANYWSHKKVPYLSQLSVSEILHIQEETCIFFSEFNTPYNEDHRSAALLSVPHLKHFFKALLSF